MNTLVETVDSVSAPPGPEAPFVAGGPLEEKHGRSQKYRNVAQDEKLTSTHWHIASANGLGWGFDGMDGAIFAPVAPKVMAEIAGVLRDYRRRVQLPMPGGILGLFLSPRLEARHVPAEPRPLH